MEEGWTEGEVAHTIAHRYLVELAEKDPLIDTLVLGCTHYPLLAKTIGKAAAEVFAHDVKLVDSAGAMARVTQATLIQRGELRAPGPGGSLRCFVTDASRLDEMAARFLGEPLAGYQTVDLRT